MAGLSEMSLMINGRKKQVHSVWWWNRIINITLKVHDRSWAPRNRDSSWDASVSVTIISHRGSRGGEPPVWNILRLVRLSDHDPSAYVSIAPCLPAKCQTQHDFSDRYPDIVTMSESKLESQRLHSLTCAGIPRGYVAWIMMWNFMTQCRRIS